MEDFHPARISKGHRRDIEEEAGARGRGGLQQETSIEELEDEE